MSVQKHIVFHPSSFVFVCRHPAAIGKGVQREKGKAERDDEKLEDRVAESSIQR
jgi:hypothetical protein